MTKGTIKPTTFHLSRLRLSPGNHKIAVMAYKGGQASAKEERITASAECVISCVIPQYVRLLSSDGYVITDSEGISITTKE